MSFSIKLIKKGAKKISFKILNLNIHIFFINYPYIGYFENKFINEKIDLIKKNDLLIEINYKVNRKKILIKIKRESFLKKIYLNKELKIKDLNFLIRVFVNFFLIKEKVIFFHGSSCVFKNHGYVFLGKSGAGKSTILGFAKKNNCLPVGDDTTIMYYKNCNFFLLSNPFEKKIITKRINNIKIKKIFFIKKSKICKIERITNKQKEKLLKNNLLVYEYFKTIKKTEPRLFNSIKKDNILIYFNLFLNKLIKKVDIFLLNFEKNEKFLKLLK